MKQITSPGWMHETSAQGWCTGMTQRDGVGREVRRAFRMGNTCKSMADSCQCMAKTTTICKVISLKLIKINGKKKPLESVINIWTNKLLRFWLGWHWIYGSNWEQLVMWQYWAFLSIDMDYLSTYLVIWFCSSVF